MTREEAKKAKDRLYNVSFDYYRDALIDKIFDDFEEDDKKKDSTLWHTGTPNEEDWYLIQLVDHKNGGIPYQIVRWTGKWAIHFTIPNEEVVAWQKIYP